MPKRTVNGSKRWSVDETRQLRRLAAENTHTRAIALKLGRSESSIAQHAHRNGISLRVRRPSSSRAANDS